MQKLLLNTFLVAAVGGTLVFGCADDDSIPGGTGGAHSAGGKAASGGGSARGGSGGSIATTGGAENAGAPSGGSAGSAGKGVGGAPDTSMAGSGGSGPIGSGGTSAGTLGSGGVAVSNGGVLGNGGTSVTGNGGTSVTGNGGTGLISGNVGGGGAGGEGGVGGSGGGFEVAGAGAGGEAVDPLVARGSYLVKAVAMCNGCHNDSTKPNDFLGGNPNFKSGGVVIAAPNLTPDSTGLGDWTDEDVKRAIRDGLDPQDRKLAAAMPYWLYHNLSDADADAIVAFLRSIPKVVNIVGDSNVSAPPVAFLSPSAFPDTSLTTSPDLESAQEGKYLLTSAARCVACHSPSTSGVPAPGFAGRSPTMSGSVYPANLTPDATGIAGWTAADVASVLKTSLAKGTTTPICNMPKYAALTDEDALAIGRYLTTIPAVENASASLPALPACP